MKWPVKNPELRLRLKKGIDSLKKIAPPPPDDLLYPWLAAVYRLRRLIPKAGKKAAAEAVDGLAVDIHPNLRADFIRAFVELSAKPHMKTKMKNKYANALGWALVNKVHSRNVIEFMKDAGGINICDQMYRQSQKKLKQKAKSALKVTTRKPSKVVAKART